MEPTLCPKCGNPLPAGEAGARSCPACLLGLGLSAADTSPDGAPLPAGPETDPVSVGPYRIVSRLGEGGMGTVYLAEQASPVRRRVALKVVKRGVGSRDVIRRFDAERQALARMDHPSIARVYDAGETADGLPYFAMEYVEGEPITSHCDRGRLDVRARLELLAEVCIAVQHAHHKGVIHRDIKPSNILVAMVDGRAVPKVIDFGVAKAIEQRLTERTLFTELGMLVGTPEYMSPEQAELTGERVDTRTDVYSLGVLQYELMTGALPFDPAGLRAGGFEQICRRIREEEPSRPSARVSGAGEAITRSARLRGVDVATFRRQLAGDLDWVTMKALDKDPERRYGSPQELADDLRRYLRHEPVLAGPPSAAYKMRKFVRRNRLAVASTAAVLAALVLGAIAATTFALREAVQRRGAERARAELEKVVEFQSRMISDIDPPAMGTRLLADLRRRIGDAARGGGAAEAAALEGRLDQALGAVNGTDAALRVLDEEILERAARVIEAEFGGEPLIEARLRISLAGTYHEIGLYDRARPHVERALELRRRALGDEHPDTLRVLQLLASNDFKRGRLEEAAAADRDVIDGLRRALGADHPDTLSARHHLGFVYRQQGRYDEAEQILLETLEARRRVLGLEALQTLDTMEALAMLYGYTGRDLQAEPLLRQVTAVRRREQGADHPMTLRSMEMLATNVSDLGRLGEAERLYLDLIEAERRVRGTEHPELAVTLNNLAKVYVAQGRADEAIATFREALAIGERRLGPDHHNTLMLILNLASVETNAGRLEAAEASYESTLPRLERALGPDHNMTLLTRCNLAIVYYQRGRRREAEEMIRAAADHPRATAEIKRRAADFFVAWPPDADPGAAVRYAAQAVEMTERRDIRNLTTLASALAQAGRIEEAGRTWQEAVALPQVGAAQLNSYAWFLLNEAADDPSSAPAAVELALRAVEPPGDRNPDYLDTLALAYHRTGRSGEAVETMERALSLVAPDDAQRRGPFVERLETYRAAAAATP